MPKVTDLVHYVDGTSDSAAIVTATQGDDDNGSVNLVSFGSDGSVVGHSSVPHISNATVPAEGDTPASTSAHWRYEHEG